MPSKTIVIVGATGAQGGGLVRAIQADPAAGFVARALTRKVNSDKASALAGEGIDVVAADTDNVESLKRAFDGAYGVFCVTNYWEHFSVEREQAQARNMAAAAKATGVQHAIWSTLEDTRRWVPIADDRMPTLQGKYKVPHFDSKGEADQFFRDADVPTTFLLTSFYWDNFIFFGLGPKRGPDGVLAITLPMADEELPGMAAEDIGRCALGVLRRTDLIGKTVGVAGEHLTGAEIATALTRALGQDVRYNDVPPDVYRGFGFPGADDLGNMFQFKRDFNEYFCGARDLEFSRALNPALQTFDAWLATHKNQIPLD
jgi:uncharacterized protein YbjT (DUF2867 family)